MTETERLLQDIATKLPDMAKGAAFIGSELGVVNHTLANCFYVLCAIAGLLGIILWRLW